MRKTILAALLAFGMNVITAQTNTATGSNTNTSSGNQSNEIKVPQQIASKFSTDYPNMNATWGRDGDNYTATYSDQGSNSGRKITYDKNGDLMYNDMEMNGTNYPTGIDEYYMTNFPNEKYTIWSSDDGKGNMSYYSKSKDGKTNWFDKDGKFSPNRPKSTNTSADTKSSKK